MMPRTKCLPTLLSLMVAFLALVTAAPAPTSSRENQQVENLFAFARLYGYVRYFHPSDQAAGIDWDKFAVYGAERVASVKTPEELKQVLEELFLPVAPLMRLCADSPPAPCPSPTFTPEQKAGKVLAWQHLGVAGTGPMYNSVRTGRAALKGVSGFGGLGQSIPAAELRGKTIRIRAAVRAQVDGLGKAAVWGRVDRPNQQMGWFNNMSDRPIVDPQWKEYEISGPVADDADRLAFGCFMTGTGEVRVDAWRIEVQKADGTWEEVKIANPDFESTGETVDGWFPIGTSTTDYLLGPVSDSDVYSGKRSARIRSPKAPGGIDQLFSEKPALGEFIDRPIAKDLRVVLPLALPDPSPAAPDNQRLADLTAKLAAVNAAASTAGNMAVRLGAIVVAWNVFQHFFPYFDVVKADWPAEFRRAATKSLADASPEDFYVTLATMVAALQDGHVNIYSQDLPRLRLPVGFDCLEDTVVVTGSKDSQVERGDVVLEVNGQKAAEYLAGLERLISGSPQWKRCKALAFDFGAGPPGSKTTLKLRRKAQTFLVTLTPTLPDLFRPESSRPAIDRLSPDIFYVDMRRAKMAEIRPRLEELASVRGVIFDLRGYPTDNHDVLSHLTDTPIQSAIWQVARTIYPDREKLAGYEERGRWTLEPLKPRLRKAIFLTSASAISYAESIMGIVEYYHLGEIVGEPTAGANGNVNGVSLPGRFGMSWTGMRVIKYDGSQHHTIGIRPTVPVRRTLRAFDEGRDEVLEKAVELLTSK